MNVLFEWVFIATRNIDAKGVLATWQVNGALFGYFKKCGKGRSGRAREALLIFDYNVQTQKQTDHPAQYCHHWPLQPPRKRYRGGFLPSTPSHTSTTYTHTLLAFLRQTQKQSRATSPALPQKRSHQRRQRTTSTSQPTAILSLLSLSFIVLPLPLFPRIVQLPHDASRQQRRTAKKAPQKNVDGP